VHDWHLADEILKIVLNYANKNNFKSVKKINLELGSIVEHGEEISPENLIHNIKLLGEKTIIRNADIRVKKITCLPAGKKENTWKLVDIEGS